MRNFKEIREQGDLLYETVRGSTLFGLATENSDIDTFGLFIARPEELLGTRLRYAPMVNSEKNDDTWDELEKFIVELGKSNPNALEALFTPKKFILHLNPIIQPLLDIRDSLITKQCFKSFRGYAKSQINKMAGLSKAMNIDPDEVKTRKTPLNFCWVPRPKNDGIWSLEKWLRENGIKEKYCGLARLPNGENLYTAYYDWFADKDLRVEDYARLRYNSGPTPEIERELEEGKKTGMIKYRGILDPSAQDTTQLRLSSISKEDAKEPIATFQFNQSAFQNHCRKYKEYWGWVKNRNQKRYRENVGHNFDCYLESETEFLTLSGWKKFDEVNENDLIGCFDSNLEVRYLPIIEKTDQLYSGTIFTYEGRHSRFSITPNHKLFIQSFKASDKSCRGDWFLIPAETFLSEGPSRTFQVRCLNNPLEDNQEYSDEFIQLLGFYISEGSATYYQNWRGKLDKTRPNKIRISNVETGNLVEPMRNLMKIFDIREYSHKRRYRDKIELTWEIRDRSICKKLFEAGIGSFNKHLPEYVKTFSTRQFNILLDSLILGDGYTHKKGHRIYYTFSYELARDLQTEIILNGNFAQIYGVKTEYLQDSPSNFKPKSGELHRSYQVFISKNTDNITTISKKRKKNSNWSFRSVVNERIVCFTTPTGTLITRNSEKIAFHGNSKNSCHAIRLLRVGKELAEGKGFQLDRTNIDREELIKVKTHGYSFEEVRDKILTAEEEMKIAFSKSDLPEEPDKELLEDILIDIRLKHYKMDI